MADHERHQFIRVAKAVIRFNPSQHGYTPEQVADHMIATARVNLKDASYIATGGWMVTSYWHKDGDGFEELHFVPSIASHIADQIAAGTPAQESAR